MKTNLPTDDSNCSSGKVNMNLNLHTLSNTVNSGNLSEMFEKRSLREVLVIPSPERSKDNSGWIHSTVPIL